MLAALAASKPFPPQAALGRPRNQGSTAHRLVAEEAAPEVQHSGRLLHRNLPTGCVAPEGQAVLHVLWLRPSSASAASTAAALAAACDPILSCRLVGAHRKEAADGRVLDLARRRLALQHPPHRRALQAPPSKGREVRQLSTLHGASRRGWQVAGPCMPRPLTPPLLPPSYIRATPGWQHISGPKETTDLVREERELQARRNIHCSCMQEPAGGWQQGHPNNLLLPQWKGPFLPGCAACRAATGGGKPRLASPPHQHACAGPLKNKATVPEPLGSLPSPEASLPIPAQPPTHPGTHRQVHAARFRLVVSSRLSTRSSTSTGRSTSRLGRAGSALAGSGSGGSDILLGRAVKQEARLPGRRTGKWGQ